MTTDQWIQIATLTVAVIPLAAFVVKRYVYDRRRGVSITGKIAPRYGAYINEVAVERVPPHAVAAVAIWCRIEIYNRSGTRVVIRRLYGNDSAGGREEVLDPLFRAISSANGNVTPTDSFRLPISLDPQDFIEFWCLINVRMRQFIGRPMFAVFGQPTFSTSGFKAVAGHFEEMERRMTNAMPERLTKLTGVKLVSTEIAALRLRDLVLEQQPDGYKVNARLGCVPRFGSAKIWANVTEKDAVAMATDGSAAGTYALAAALADGRVIEHRIAYRDPTWFLDDHHPASV